MELKETLDIAKTRFTELEAKYKAEKEKDYRSSAKNTYFSCHLIREYLERFLSRIESEEPVTEVQVLRILFEEYVDVSDNPDYYTDRLALQAIYKMITKRKSVDAQNLDTIGHKLADEIISEELGRMNDELTRNALASCWSDDD